jgi:hypothetical protein
MSIDRTPHPALQKLRETHPADAAAWQSELDYVRRVSADGPKVPQQGVGAILGEKIMLMVLTVELLSIASYALWTWVLNR